MLSEKQLELLKEAVPGVSRVAVLWDPAATTQDLLSAMEGAARSLAVQLQLLTLHRVRIAELALKSRLPAMALFSEFAEAGCLMTYGPNLSGQVRRAAAYVDRILKGAKPADLPVEQPMWFELIINLKTAKTLGLTIAPEVLYRADRLVR